MLVVSYKMVFIKNDIGLLYLTMWEHARAFTGKI